MKILILPGLDGAASIRAEFQQLLDSRYSAQAISYPADIGDFDYDALAEFVTTHFPEGGNAIIVAESFSGPVAINIAAKRPPNLRAIIFIATFARAPVPFASTISSLLPMLPFNSVIARDLAIKLLVGGNGAAILKDSLRTVLHELPPDLIKKRLSLVLEVNVMQRFSALSLPMLYIQAKSDALLGEGPYRAMKNLNDNLALEVIDGPHFLSGAKPVECAEAISRFIESL